MKKTRIEIQNTILIIIGVVIIVLLAILLTKNGGLSFARSSPQPEVQGSATSGTTNIGDNPYLGDKSKAKVAIVEFSDYECPFCKTFHDETYNQIIEKYVKTGQAIFVHRDLPLPLHGDAAKQDAFAALCAKDLGGNEKYFQMADLIFQNTGQNGAGINKDKMIDLAVQVGLSKSQFSDCFSSNKFQTNIDNDVKEADRVGVGATPSFVVGRLSANGEVKGELIVGAQKFDTFQPTIDKQLSAK